MRPALHGWIRPLMYSALLSASVLAVHASALTTNNNALSDDPLTEAQARIADKAPPLTPFEIFQLNQFHAPQYTEQQKLEVLSHYQFVDPTHKVPDKLLEKALTYYNANLSHISNKTYLSVVDFSAYSGKARFFIINMNTGSVWELHVAHGTNSDPDNDGYATKFSNTVNSNQSSLGFYKTAETYSGVHGYSLRLDGLSSTNSKVRARAIVVHGADYVYDSNTKPGRSWGCLAVPMNDRTQLVNEIRNGSIIYAGLSK